MRVTEDDSGQADSLSIGVEFCEVVQDPDHVPADLDEVLRRKAVRPSAPVVIATDRADGGKIPERLQDDGVTDVAAMNDEVRTSQRLERLGPN